MVLSLYCCNEGFVHLGLCHMSVVEFSHPRHVSETTHDCDAWGPCQQSGQDNAHLSLWAALGIKLKAPC